MEENFKFHDKGAPSAGETRLCGSRSAASTALNLLVSTKFSSTDKRQVDDLQLGQAISTDKRQVDVDHEVNPGDNGRAEDRVGF